MSESALNRHSIPPLQAEWALFLDVDGTLLDIAERPDAVRVEKELVALLEWLYGRQNGALALISGRALSDLDRLFEPLQLPAAGQHGAEYRDASGRIYRDERDLQALRQARTQLASFAEAHPGTLLEDKGLSLALHYRSAPAAEEAARRAVRTLARAEGLAILEGKMVLELKPAGYDKGVAVDELMATPPFAGRLPVFVGDDITDEDGFHAVNRRNGHSLKVGDGPTRAQWRLPDRDSTLAWLAAGAGNLPTLESDD